MRASVRVDLALLVLRLVLGAAFIFHGYPKFRPSRKGSSRQTRRPER
jgi:uncharacterized membrane protein YphA (DoxX/SURF4 family)